MKSRPGLSIATLSSELAATAPDAFRLLPAGLFRARDGRPEGLPGWRLDPEDMQRMVAEAEARETDYVIDYEHQAIEAKRNGQPAPAAGWFRQLEARKDGLWVVDVRWTERARRMIEAGEYRYISPVFSYDKKTGRVTRLLMAAITNTPALDGLTDLMPYSEDTTMSESLAALAAHLKIDAGEDAADAALKRIQALEDELASLKAASIPMSEHAKLQAEITALRAEMEAAERSRLLEAGLADGRILPAQRDYWAAQPLAALKAWLEVAQPVAALTETQSSRVASNASTVLTDEDRYVIEKLGLSEQAFIAAKARMTIADKE